MTVTIVQPAAFLITPVEHLKDYEKLIELAGRTAYKSEDRIDSTSAQRFIKTIISNGHESVIEHASISYRIVCSRACSHQCVRHRLNSFTQESQRYCDYGKRGFQIIIPPSIERDPPQLGLFMIACESAYEDYCRLRNSGVPPEDARFLLPNASKTEIVITCNIRQWRHIIQERALNPHAQWEIKGIMLAILYELNTYLPTLFADLIDKLIDKAITKHEEGQLEQNAEQK